MSGRSVSVERSSEVGIGRLVNKDAKRVKDKNIHLINELLKNNQVLRKENELLR